MMAAFGALGFVATFGSFMGNESLLIEPGLVFTSSVLRANEALSITVNNLEADAAQYSFTIFLPALAGLGLWIYQFQSDDDMVRRGGRPEVTLYDGMMAVRMGLAAQRSAETGEAVTVVSEPATQKVSA